MTQGSAPPLWQLSAAELGAAFRGKIATPGEAVNAVFDRIGAVNGRINAFATLDKAGAQDAAEASTRRWAADRPLSPLDGVPISIKDNILVGGLRATWGSKLFAHYVPDTDEEPVARLRAAGAIILGKTNVPEFTLHGYTDNALFGPTRNPWALELTPGGSSGAAVAAVAAGCGPLALCTDGGGSIRRPAAHTGLVGFKPSRGAVPRANGFPAILHDFEVAGPVARHVADIDLVMAVIAETLRVEGASAAIAKPTRILYVPTFSAAPVDPSIATAVEQVAGAFVEQGHAVTRDDDFNLAAPIADVWPVISQAGLAWLLSRHPDAETLVAPVFVEMARNGRAFAATDYVNALAVVKDVDRQFATLFERFDFLLSPATAAMPWPATQSHPDFIAGQPVGPRGHAVFTPFANALGLPAIALPCAVEAPNLPIGFQLCAARGRDRALLDFARAYERTVGWPDRWPQLA